MALVETGRRIPSPRLHTMCRSELTFARLVGEAYLLTMLHVQFSIRRRCSIRLKTVSRVCFAYLSPRIASRATAALTSAERAALAAELPPERSGTVAIVESGAVAGAGVQVVYKDGALRIEVGPKAEPRHVRYHVGTTRHLLSYQGPLGQIRRLLDAIMPMPLSLRSGECHSEGIALLQVTMTLKLRKKVLCVYPSMSMASK